MSPLTGEFDITGRTAVDVPPEEPRETHFRVYLTGDAAKGLYEHMRVEPMADGCGGRGTVEKAIGNMVCALHERKEQYECWFAIDINNQRIEGGWAFVNP